MATLALTAVGSLIGGPIGGSIGALLGNKIDNSLFGPDDREGPRLTELAVTTSSYGTPVARHFGTMRAPGTIIWATDLIEASETTGGGKGQPGTTSFSYSISFAVALSSQPIAAVKRIWADGNLLRGSAGDLKVGGAFRLHTGEGDQLPDPLIASAEGAACPAFRGIAYCVFEDLQLADFGNRIPTLTFEIEAGGGDVTMLDLLRHVPAEVTSDVSLTGLAGYTDSGGTVRASLETIRLAYPFDCDASDAAVTLLLPRTATPPVTLAEPVADSSEEAFGALSGRRDAMQTDRRGLPGGMRYYDKARDYQPGLQRTGGQARGGRDRIIEFPGALEAATARSLVDQAAGRADWSRQSLSYRTAEIREDVAAGSIVRVPGRGGLWRVEEWEWRASGVELQLTRYTSPVASFDSGSDPGRVNTPRDAVAGETVLTAFELPWDGTGSPDTAAPFAAVSSPQAGWTGATLYRVEGAGLEPLGGTGRARSVIGTTHSDLLPSAALYLEPDAAIEVELVASDLSLASALPTDLLAGANRALIGGELVQFASAIHGGGAAWRLQGLLRGRGGTEAAAAGGQAAGASFVLLNGTPVAAEGVSANTLEMAAIGLVDTDPVRSPVRNRGIARRPLIPVHPRAEPAEDGSLDLRWTRRARGAWLWDSTVEVPLVEQHERYEVGVGDIQSPVASWIVEAPRHRLDAATVRQLGADWPTAPVWVRQIGSFDRSLPLLLTTLA